MPVQRRWIGSLATILVAATSVVGLAQSATAAPRHGLPADAPAALYRAEPALPKAKGWPASNTAFSQTSGTGRYADGGYYWTDFLYDDHGTTTASGGNLAVTAGTPSFGTYTYPSGPANNNGADIFRAAVALRPHATYWRVDWQTLVSPTVPIAEWTFDRDDNVTTGGATWPADAKVASPGIDTALVVSSRGARLIKVSSGKTIARLHTTVTKAAHSFVVRIPTSVLEPTRTWRIRLAAGLANPAGTGFAPAPDALPIQTRVYNVTFRKRTQEKPSANFWDDNAQTTALLTGDVSTFSAALPWARLRHHATTAQPRPTGWSDRWYVSAVAPGQGVIADVASVADGKANFLNRVQPYAVFVPPSYRPNGMPAPLTFLLHSSNQNHNQYAATTPSFVTEACTDRHSICVSPLGRGPDGNYYDSAELDFWQVWREVALAYHLSPDHTVLSGYSMGGIGANQLAIAHPDLFARSVTLAGGVGDIDSLGNLRWVPTYLAGGAEDELVPVTLEAGEANALAALGDRFRWIVVSAIDHVSYELADSFADAARYMQPDTLVTRPGRISFTWTPANTPAPDGTSVAASAGIGWTQLPKLGVGTTGAYWLRDLHARSAKQDASVTAASGERPDRAVTPHKTQQIDPGFQPEPAVVTTQTWSLGKRSVKHAKLELTLTNVRSVKVLLSMAGFHPGQHVVATIRTDGGTTIRLGHDIVHLAKGRHVVRFAA
jgi:dienelactone hydrolase